MNKYMNIYIYIYIYRLQNIHNLKVKKKQESSRKTSTPGLLTMPKLLTVWITINYGKL